MPANLSPEYRAAETAFRQAREPKERLECLREMLRTIPKHKGTDHLQADIKKRIKELTEELAGPKKGGARGGPSIVIRPEGAAQIALIGPPNTGKSALHASLTGSDAGVGPYPYTTQYPQPGMLPHEDIHFQLVDLPPVCRDHGVPWLGNALQPADACLLVVDLSDPDCVDRTLYVRESLEKKRILLTSAWDPSAEDPDIDAELRDNPFALLLPTLLIANKADLIADLAGELEVFLDLTSLHYPFLATSATGCQGMERIAPWLFEHLHIVRVYTKAPGRPADHDKPFTLRRGGTVQDVAGQVHRDIAASMHHARLWRGTMFKGQPVGREHPLEDGDVIEIHS